MRSTWDYQGRREEFLQWARRMGALFNSPEVLAWNTDKRYLADLPAQGVPVVETSFIEPGQEPALPQEGEWVVKPSVSAGARDTARFDLGRAPERQRAESLLGQIRAGGRTAILQPYLAAVDELGETALIHIDGRYSHAIRKGPLLRPGAPPTEGLFAPETIEPRAPEANERKLAERVVAMVSERFGKPLYARVDLLRGPTGEPLVLELELTEPSLFFAHAEGAAARLATAISGRL